ncbi:MAG: extracellular solute-binding protein [Oscillospiraceae bacterium]|jgi:putative aldouronate transport system substrate-binding protein|nr:extracellular solute-binding protein [Oscillospiraceae bacterium]
MKTRMLALLLVLLMVLAATACASKSPSDSGANPSGTSPSQSTPGTSPSPSEPYVVTEPVTLTAYQWALDNQTTDFANLWYYQELAKDTNVTVDFTVIKENDWNERLNLMFISGAYPDMIIRPNNNLSIEEYGVTQGIIIPLDDLIPTYMPNYNSRIGLNNAKDVLRASNGKMYYVGYMDAQGVVVNAAWFINQTWLTAVNKSVPTTIDELTDVLKAFRDGKPGTGNNTYPMSAGGNIYHQTNGIYTYYSMFGVPLQFYVYAAIQDDGTVVFPGYMDGFREASEWLNMCYNENLLDKEALNQSDNDKNNKVNADEVGFITYLRLLNTAWTADTIANWVNIMPPATARGAKLPRDFETDIPAFGAVLTTTNKNIPASLLWLDAQLETERMMVAKNGNIGPGPFDPPPLGRRDDGTYFVEYVPDENALFTAVPVTQGQFFAPGDYIFDVYEMAPHRVERYDNSQKYDKAGIVEKNSYLILTKYLKPEPDDAERLGRLYEDLHTFMQEAIADFIMNGVTDANWALFLDRAKNAGADEYVALYQKLYNEYKAALG